MKRKLKRIHLHIYSMPFHVTSVFFLLYYINLIFQLQKIDCTKIFCITGSAGELGSGGNAIVRLALEGAFGYVAVKCFSVHGGDVDKWKIVKKYA